MMKKIKWVIINEPIVLLIFIAALGILYDCIANYATLSTKDWIKSGLFVILGLWGCYGYVKSAKID
jgi:hypothetical protein